MSMSDHGVRVKLTLHYDGAAFRGWQRQPKQPTIQGTLEDAVRQLVGERRTVSGSGRTDTGVHATGQVAALTVPPPWTAPRLQRALNALLPHSIWVQDASTVHPSFNPRYDATSRSYRYHVGVAGLAASPFHSRWCWSLERELDIGAARRASGLLVGRHDFGSFAKSGQPWRGHRCSVTRARWTHWEDIGWTFEISADRFLHRMVRYLVGTMVDIALKRRDEAEMALLLAGEKGVVTSPPAPARGLFLARVTYSSTPARPLPEAAQDRPARPPSSPAPEAGMTADTGARGR